MNVRLGQFHVIMLLLHQPNIIARAVKRSWPNWSGEKLFRIMQSQSHCVCLNCVKYDLIYINLFQITPVYATEI